MMLADTQFTPRAMAVRISTLLILSVLAVGMSIPASGHVDSLVNQQAPSEADIVVLRPTAAVPHGKITLGQIASVQGGQSEAISSIVIAEDLSQVPGSKVTLDAISELVHAAAAARRGSLNAGRIAFHGSVCILSKGVAIEPVAVPAEPMASAEQSSAVADSETIRGLIAERLPGLLGLDPMQTRLTFDELDRRVLSASAKGAKVDLKVLALADRLPLQVAVYSEQSPGEYTLGNSCTVRVSVEVQRAVVTTIAPMKRGDSIDSSHVTTKTEWLALTKKPLEVGEAVGSVVKQTKVPAGAVLLAGDVEPAVLVQKGQILTVHCISGPFIIKTQARALEAGRSGQIIKFAPLDVRDKKDKRAFQAKVETSGRAIMTVDGDRADAGR